MPSLTRWQIAWVAVAALVCMVASASLWRHRPGASGPLAVTTGAPALAPRPHGLVTPLDGPIYVHVTGHVAKPGLYRMPAGSRVMDAISYAGGAADDASLDSLNLATALRDGQKLTVPSLGESPPPPADSYIADSPDVVPHPELIRPDPPEPAPAPPPARSSLSASDVETGFDAPSRSGSVAKLRRPGDGTVNINLAEASELQRLPGVGPATAIKIIEYREEHGGFGTVEELMEVRGIGPAKLRKMQPFVTLGNRGS